MSYDTATALDSKQDTISDLTEIRNNAAAGSAAADAIGSTASLNGKTLVEAINAVKATADAALTSASLEEYTTASEVATAINSAKASGSITVLTTWNSTAEETVPVNGTVSAAEETFETVESLETRLKKMYSKVEVSNVESIAIFSCVK